MKRLYLVLLVLGIGMVACTPHLQPNPADAFGESQKEFAKRLVWKDYGSAASFFDSELRQDFLDKFPDRGDIRVLEIRPAGVEFDQPEQERAVARLDIEYYRLPSNTLKNLQLRMEWAYRDGSWEIVSPFPDLP